MKWLAAEALEGYSYGQGVPGVVAAFARGAKVVHIVNGKPIFVECVDGADLEGFMRRPARCDPRILDQLEKSLQDMATSCHARET